MVDPVKSAVLGLPPLWMARVIANAGQVGDSDEVRRKLRKLLGDPTPEEVDLEDIPPEIAALFTQGGLLQRIRKKLETITKRPAKRIAAAKGKSASVDEDDVVYVGVDFLEQYKNREDLVAGILAHEWGHMVSNLPPDTELDNMTLDDLLAVRRDEEAGADAFAGRALYLMGYSVDDMVEFLTNLEKIERKIKTKKYHPAEIREAILKEAWAHQKRAEETARRLLVVPHLGFSHAAKSRLIGEG